MFRSVEVVPIAQGRLELVLYQLDWGIRKFATSPYLHQNTAGLDT